MTDSNGDTVGDRSHTVADSLTVVGIGTSAGGLDALQRFFESLPDDTGMAYVVVQHLAPSQKSELPSILQRYSSLSVQVIADSVQMQPDHVYVIPPARSLTIEENTLHLGVSVRGRAERVSIDHFLESLAEAKRNKAIAVILSGSGHDGSRGIVAIKERDGLTLAQSPNDAQYSSMPVSAIDTGSIDLVLPADELARRLASFAAGTRDIVEDQLPDQNGDDVAYRRILARLHTTTGHDFSNYKRSTISRRIDRRLRLLQLSDLPAYLDHLQSNPDELHALFDELLITVTEFFRDDEAFAALEKKVIPHLYDHREPDKAIRVWVPACATGEEVYSIAMLLWEEAQRRDLHPEFKIFATDLDARAIDLARQGLFSRAACQRIERSRRERFFHADSGGLRVAGELRDRVLFAVHDVLKDPPFARQDLISCRNLLIYLDDTAQRQLFSVLHYALNRDGRLFLGVSEFLGDATDLFAPIDNTHRIYRPKEVDRHLLPLPHITEYNQPSVDLETPSFDIDQAPRRDIEQRHARLLSEQFAPPAVLVDEHYEIIHISGDVHDYLRIPPGQPTQKLFDTVHPDLRVELRAALTDAFDTGKRTTTRKFFFRPGDDAVCVRLHIQLMPDPADDEMPIAQVVFESIDDADLVTALEPDKIPDADATLQKAVDQLETENDRLKRQLHDNLERYETTTEELRTSNEELLSINEELQSTTEELQTSKEELQSTNEELTTVNDELSHKICELDEANSDLQNLLSATDIGTIFLDCQFHIRRFTDPVRDYFNIRDDDIDRPLEHVTHHLDYDEMLDDAHRVLDHLETIEREVQCRTHQWFIVRLVPYRTVDDRIDGVVITFFDITDRKRVQQQLTERELLFRTLFERASDALFFFHLDDAHQPQAFTEVNNSACQRLGYSESDLLKMSIADLVEPESLDLDAYLHDLRNNTEATAEVRFQTRSGKSIVEEIRSRYFLFDDEPTVITVSRDITSQKAHEQALVSAKEESEHLAELRASFLANMSHEIRTPLTSIIGVSQLLAREDLPERHHTMVQLVRTSGQRLKQTLDSVLDLSRIEAGEMQPRSQSVDIVDEVRDDIDTLRPNAERKEIDLQFNPSHGEFFFVTDPGFVTRIVYNLVENAIKFTDEGRVTVDLDVDSDELQLVVSDTGIGISEDFLPHLFDKFKQASRGSTRGYEGSGLGMALVHHLVELMDGEISVDSKKGQGTTFTVILPAHEEESNGADDSASVNDE